MALIEAAAPAVHDVAGAPLLNIAGPTDLFWTVAVGMGFAVVIVVIILLNLLNKSVKALDTRVDHVWEAAAAVHGLTSTVAPQLRTAEQAVGGLVNALRGGGASTATRPAPGPARATSSAPTPAPARPAPRFQPTGPVGTKNVGTPSTGTQPQPTPTRPRPGRRW